MSKGQTTVETLERGHIYFLYRPRVDEHHPTGREDVQRLYMVLSPQDSNHLRLIVIGRKKLPDPSASGSGRFWCFVDRVTNRADTLERDLREQHYGTKTRGTQEQPAARPAGEGVYRIVRHDGHTHLVYALELPTRLKAVQEAFNIAHQASYVISVKNPKTGSPRAVGLDASRQASYPKSLQKRFRGRRFGEVDPPAFLDHAGSELLLIAAAEDVQEELGLRLHREHESETEAAVFADLALDRESHPVEPLLGGYWR